MSVGAVVGSKYDVAISVVMDMHTYLFISRITFNLR